MEKHVPLILSAIFLLNVLDLGATLFLVDGGYAIEANPIMAQALSMHVLVFIFLKLIVVLTGLFVFWTYRKRAMAKIGMLVIFGIYFMLGLYHLAGLFSISI